MYSISAVQLSCLSRLFTAGHREVNCSENLFWKNLNHFLSKGKLQRTQYVSHIVLPYLVKGIFHIFRPR